MTDDISWVVNLRYTQITPVFEFFTWLGYRDFLFLFIPFIYWCFDRKKFGRLVLLVFFAGKSLSLENELIRIKKETNILLINELGDEPQTLIKNDIRAEISDLILTPDHRCNLYWKNQDYNSIWFNHWADTNIFYEIPNSTKNKFLISTMGRRKYNLFLKFFSTRSSQEFLLGPWDPRLLHYLSKYQS